MLEHLSALEIEQIEKAITHQVQIHNSQTKHPARRHRTDKLELVETPVSGQAGPRLVHHRAQVVVEIVDGVDRVLHQPWRYSSSGIYQFLCCHNVRQIRPIVVCVV